MSIIWSPLKTNSGPSFTRIDEPLLSYGVSRREEDEASPSDSGIGSYPDVTPLHVPGSPEDLPISGPVISFRNVLYEIEGPARGTLCAKLHKEILHNVGGIFKYGMNAILGPTGSGKTTLLDILSGRKRPHRESGPILIDGRKQPRNFKLIAGYVKQDDVLMGTLTVRECLTFSATLRLPSCLSSAMKKRRVEDTLQELSLSRCANSKIGTEYVRGVSGGERKRTSIGMELIVSPNILFLDEPTTGLDGSTAMAVMALLHRLSRRGRTIVFSIHQPRFNIFKKFDRLMLLGDGRCLYHGPAAESLIFFQSIGYCCERHNNPPDFFLDVINGDVPGSPVFKRRNANREATQSREERKTIVMRLFNQFRTSFWAISLTQELDERLSIHREICGSDSSTETAFPTNIPTKFPTSFHRQLECLSKRTVLNLVRNPLLTLTQTMVSLVIAVAIGVIYWQLNSDAVDGLQNRHGAFFFLAICLCFSNLSSMEVFIRDLVIFVHESTSGYYRVSAYFFSKVFCDVIPMRIIPTTVVTIITYFMIGLESEIYKFLIYYLTLLLASMAFTSVGYFVGSLVRTFGIANLLLGALFFVMMFFAGLLINLSSMSGWISWMKNLSIVHFTVNALLINEIKNKTFIASDSSRSFDISGSDYLKEQNIDFETSWDLWKNMVALGAMSLLLLFLTFIRLLRIGHLKFV